MKIVLLNPPGTELYVRSYYCGSISKAGYLLQPIDLLMLSGILSLEHEIRVVDAIADRLSRDRTVEIIAGYKPDVLICVVSMVSWKSDSDFLLCLKNRIPSLRIIANGDVFFDEPGYFLEQNKAIEAVVFDFISSEIINYLMNKEDVLRNMVYRKGDAIISKRFPSENGLVFSIPIPRHELFMNKKYTFPFVKHYPYTTVLTNFGCLFHCAFCIGGTLGFKFRRASEVIEELLYISRLGIKEIFFEDMAFGLPKDNAVELCNMMISSGFEYSWTCLSRVDIVDEKMLLLMKRAGCHTIIFGVESASNEILRAHNKGYTSEQVLAVFSLCRKVGIKTVATFILGLPEETRSSFMETIEWAKKIGCDYASFNMAVPRPGTQLRRRAISEGLIRSDQIVFDHSGKTLGMPSKYLTEEEILKLINLARRKFYLRKGYILKRIIGIKTLTELKEHFGAFYSLVTNK